MDQLQPQPSHNRYSRVYRIMYKQGRPHTGTFTKDHTYTGTQEHIELCLKKEIGQYGGIESQLIKEEKI